MNPALRVWLVDDDASIRWVLERALRNDGMAPRAFESAEPALAALRRESPDVLITDIRMPGASGLELLRLIRDARPQLPVIVMTAHSDLGSAVSAYEGGAFEYLPKPFDIDKAVALVRRAANGAPQAGADATGAAHIPELLGRAPAMQQVFRAIGRLARSSVTVLITGESGTGKELVARALHEHSPRSGKPFLALNTAAIPADLLESELFGHERGAFTGADTQRRGRFEQADGGTLFLDEIGDMSLPLQTPCCACWRKGVLPGGWADPDPGRRARHRRHPPDTGGPRGERPVPRGPLPPAERHSHRAAAAARACRGHPRPAAALHARRRRGAGCRAQGAGAGGLRAPAARWPANVRELLNLCRGARAGPGSVVHLEDMPPGSSAPRQRRCRRLGCGLTAGLSGTRGAGAAAAGGGAAAVRARPDPRRAQAHPGAPPGSGAPLGLGPQHPHAQAQGTRHERGGRRRIVACEDSR
jgi:DNA-binding NtrC family response regulator